MEGGISRAQRADAGEDAHVARLIADEGVRANFVSRSHATKMHRREPG